VNGERVQVVEVVVKGHEKRLPAGVVAVFDIVYDDELKLLELPELMLNLIAPVLLVTTVILV